MKTKDIGITRYRIVSYKENSYKSINMLIFHAIQLLLHKLKARKPKDNRVRRYRIVSYKESSYKKHKYAYLPRHLTITLYCNNTED